MKNNSNSLINKFGDIHTELVKINKRVANLEIIQDRNNESIKEESTYRQNTEKKSFQQTEIVNAKIQNIKKSIEDLTASTNQNVEELRTQLSYEIKTKNEGLLASLEERLNKIGSLEQKTKDIENLIEKNNQETQRQIMKSVEILSTDYKKLKIDFDKQNNHINNIDKKYNDMFVNLSKDIKDLIQQMAINKNDIDMLRNFKESTIVNFKDITTEFINNEKDYIEFKNKIIYSVKESEAKLRLNDMNFSAQIEQIESFKKDIHTKLYDNSLSTNNKLQMINESLIEKFEDYDKIISRFQDNILLENSKFTDYISEQVEVSHSNTKKLLDYMNSDMNILKEKTSNVEIMIKTARNEFFNNINELEEFFTKKYEYIFRTIHSSSAEGLSSPYLRTKNQ